jgi:hypothetical protein
MASGNIIQLLDGLYEYTLPPEPRDEKDILHYDLPKKEQMWKRPHIVDAKKLNERERIGLIELHRERWLNGVWMFINGEPTYITGMHYDFLTFSKFDFGYADYLDQQRFDFYFRDLVRKDKNTYGKAILKCRRCGMTAEEIEEAIYTLLEDENANVGLQSNEHKKCLQTLMYPLIQTYLSRPRWMREEFYSPNGKKPRNSLELISNRIDVLNTESDDFLGGTVLPYPTTPAAMDGTKKRLIIQDESFKWTTASIEETLDINKKCVVEYGIKGKVDILSTMGDSDDYVNSVKEGCKIIRDSNPKVRDQNGRTTSGLYKWFVSAIHSADIPEEHREIKFGKVNKDKAEAYVWAELNKYPKDSKQYVFAMRRLPIEEKHGLMAATNVNYFSKIRIDARLQELQNLPRDRKPYVRGFLKEDTRGKVWFEADENGIWLIAIHPYFSTEKNVDTRNRFRIDDGIQFPPINPEFCIGYDPIRYRKEDTKTANLSRASAMIHKKYDYFGSGISDQRAALLLYRPDDPDEAHKEVIKACKYYGAPCMHERNIEKVKEVFEDYKMMPFLMKSEKDGKHGIWTDSGGKIVKNGIDMLVTRFSPPKEPTEPDQLAEYPFEDGLIDLDNFDIGQTTAFDVTMSEVMLEYGLKQIVYTNRTDGQTANMLAAAQAVVGMR